MSVEQRIAIEKKVICHLIRTMGKHGWIASHVNDGEERVVTRTEADVLDTVFSVDESAICFRKIGFDKGCVASIVLGNDGWDCIADHSHPSDDHEFVKIMEEEVDTYCRKLEG